MNENYKTIKLMREDGRKIENAIQIIQYLDGFVVLCADGQLFTNANITEVLDKLN